MINGKVGRDNVFNVEDIFKENKVIVFWYL